MRILVLAFALMISWSNNIFCSGLKTQLKLLQCEIFELETIKDKEEAELLRPMIKANIEYLEGRILLDIKNTEQKLEELKNNIIHNNTPEVKERWFKKMSSTEKKLENLKEALHTVEKWKTRIISIKF